MHKGLLKEPVLHSEPHGTRRPERVGENLNRRWSRPIVEVMSADFLALGFDPILNFATKPAAIYGQQINSND